MLLVLKKSRNQIHAFIFPLKSFKIHIKKRHWWRLEAKVIAKLLKFLQTKPVELIQNVIHSRNRV